MIIILQNKFIFIQTCFTEAGEVIWLNWNINFTCSRTIWILRLTKRPASETIPDQAHLVFLDSSSQPQIAASHLKVAKQALSIHDDAGFGSQDFHPRIKWKLVYR